MGDNSAADVDGAPNGKKPKLGAAESNSQSRPRKGNAGSRNFSQDGRRKGTLRLTIDEWGAFKRSTEKLYSESLGLAGVEWKVQVYAKNYCMVAALQASHPTAQPQWVRKAEFVLRWPGRPQVEYAPHSVLFWRNNPTAGWSETNYFEDVEQTGVEDESKLELTLDVTTFQCYIIEGAFGIPSRFHDVTFVVENRRVYGNKGFLAAHADFFESMFFGDFEDKNKDEVILEDVKYAHFSIFLSAIARALRRSCHQVLPLLRMADRFQAHKLAERCVEFILKEKPRNISFFEQLTIADELNMNHFRDLLIDYAPVGEIASAAAAVNEERFSKQTWMKLFLKYKQLKPPYSCRISRSH